MQVFEYYGQMSENGQLNLPDELKKTVGPGNKTESHDIPGKG